MSGARRKTRIGQVVSDKMSKTVVVAVPWQQRHPLYRKSIRRITRFAAHDESSACRVGDRVRIEETRPLSKTKRWRVIEVLMRGEELGLRPVEVGTALEQELQKPAAATPVAALEVARTADSSEKSDAALDVQAGQQPKEPDPGADRGSG